MVKVWTGISIAASSNDGREHIGTRQKRRDADVRGEKGYYIKVREIGAN